MIDVEAQCLIEDGEGNYFLCPRYKREEAVSYFEDAYNSQEAPPPLPLYLKPVQIEKLHFYKAVME